jgi:hypothetical protein
MRDTRAAEARQDRHVGSVPVGFTRANGVLLPSDAIGAPQLAFQLYATRQNSFATVADALNTAGWQTPSGGAMLGGLPGILQDADTADRRTILQALFTSIILEPHLARKAKARDEYRELLLKLDERVECTDWWAGWGSGLDPHTLVKMVPAVLRAA